VAGADDLIELHTGRVVHHAVLHHVVDAVTDLAEGGRPGAALGVLELAQLAQRYLADERTAPVANAELRQRLPFGYRWVDERGLIGPGGSIHSMVMDVLGACLARAGDSGYDVVDAVSGALIGRNELI
jgi:hypothetical protein